MAKDKLLLHVCCAPCSGFLSRELSKDYDVAIYYDNPNIFPAEEFDKRRNEAEKFFKKEKIKFISAPYDHASWLNNIKGLEKEPERGARCVLCYRARLRNTAEYAKANDIICFASALAISPHKDAKIINQIGEESAKETGVKFLAGNWKKNDGFKKAMAFSRECGFYRQDYCGCEFSKSSLGK